MALVPDTDVQTAFDWLREHHDSSAAAKARRVRAEHGVKRVRARLMRESHAKTQGEREAWAIDHPDYEAACEEEAKAVEADEWHRWGRAKAEMLIEAWRTEQSNIRAMGKIG